MIEGCIKRSGLPHRLDVGRQIVIAQICMIAYQASEHLQGSQSERICKQVSRENTGHKILTQVLQCVDKPRAGEGMGTPFDKSCLLWMEHSFGLIKR